MTKAQLEQENSELKKALANANEANNELNRTLHKVVEQVNEQSNYIKKLQQTIELYNLKKQASEKFTDREKYY